MRNLPPLNWIRAFEAAARHQSFLRAGEELGVSAGAISQKVKLLEERLGVGLFERHPRGVQLTEAGARYQCELTPALDSIAAASDQVAPRGQDRPLRIAALPALAEKWLTPRLSRFHDRHPEIAVEVAVAPELDGSGNRAFDLAVHYERTCAGRGESVVLFQDRMAPVCSPEFADNKNITEPTDLLDCRLLYDTQWPNDWSHWFGAAELPADAGKRESGFALYSMAVEAAVESLGVVMGHHALVERELDAGRLIQPFELSVPVPHSYAVVVPDNQAPRSRVATFVDWLCAECVQGAAP